MNREDALRISDRLVSAGKTHTVVVGVHDGRVPRESYTVNITPALTYTPTDITELQNIATELSLKIAYCAGAFTFVGRDVQ
jgi:hypothetical protein